MATCLTNVVEIERETCIGDSREDINSNFQNLKNAICALNTNTTTIEDQLIYLVPFGGILNFKGDITLGGDNFDLSGAGKRNSLTGQNLSCYALCNGNNGTPDLRDRFVVAAGSNYRQGDKGPIFNSTASLQFSSVQLTIPEMAKHLHGVTDPGHVHPITDSKHLHTYTDKYNPGSIMNISGIPTLVFGTDRFAEVDKDHKKTTSLDRTGVTVNPAKADIDINPRGNDQRHENRPPFIALAYIMRYKL